MNCTCAHSPLLFRLRRYRRYSYRQGPLGIARSVATAPAEYVAEQGLCKSEKIQLVIHAAATLIESAVDLGLSYQPLTSDVSDGLDATDTSLVVRPQEV